MQWLFHRYHSRKLLISLWSLSVLIGIGLVQLNIMSLSGAAIMSAIVLVVASFARSRLQILFVIGAGLMVGNIQGSFTARELNTLSSYLDQTVIVEGVIVDDPTYGRRSERVFILGDISIDDEHYPGRLSASSFSFVSVTRGDRVEIKGKLRPGFRPYQAKLSFGDITKVEKGDSLILKLRDSFSAAIYTAMPDPAASLGLGFLLGQRSVLPDTLDDQFRALSLTHIVVASGYNLTILIRASRRLLENHSKYLAMVSSLGLMAGFVAITGFSPSMTRASLVTTLSLLAWYYGRKIHPIVLILFAAAVTGLINPIYVWGDLGWYLSFLAFSGILILAPLVKQRLFGKHEQPFVRSLIIETLAAQIMTLPVIMLVFGTVSLLAIPANLLVAPLIPLAMLLTLMGGVGQLLLPAIGAWIAWPASILTGWIMLVVAWLANVPWATVSAHLNPLLMVVSYCFITALIIVLWVRTGFDFLRVNITDR